MHFIDWEWMRKFTACYWGGEKSIGRLGNLQWSVDPPVLSLPVKFFKFTRFGLGFHWATRLIGSKARKKNNKTNWWIYFTTDYHIRLKLYVELFVWIRNALSTQITVIKINAYFHRWMFSFPHLFITGFHILIQTHIIHLLFSLILFT